LACFNTPRLEEELYHIPTDPFELKNLSNDPAYKEILISLRLKLKEIRKKSNDNLHVFRTPDEFDRNTGKSNAFRKRPRPSKVEMEKIILKRNE